MLRELVARPHCCTYFMYQRQLNTFNLTNKNIKMRSFKSSENIQKKENGPDRSVSDNQSSSVVLNEQ